MERALVLIKPDAMVKKLAGNIINDFYNLDLRIIGLKLVSVEKELAEMHYHDLEQRKGKKIFEDTVRYLKGDHHNHKNIIAIVYQGKDAVKKVREFVGETNPEKAKPSTIRGKYGRVIKEKDLFENVVHVSDSKESAEKEIKVWFREEELV